MLKFEIAQKLLADVTTPLSEIERVSLAHAAGRVLATTLTATIELPSGDSCAMDGYAIRFADYHEGRVLPIQQRCYAGDMPMPIVPGQATRLFTGSIMPPGADTVVIQEFAREHREGVEFLRPPRARQHVRFRGEDSTAGQTLLTAGVLLAPQHIAVLASQGIAEVDVFERLRVGILTTGDELVAPGQYRNTQQNYNANASLLSSLVGRMGAEVTRVLHARDNAHDLKNAFENLLAECHLVVSVGGVSAGERDLVRPVLESIGGHLEFSKVQMKPGKPMAFFNVMGKPVVCLPGNPGAAFAVFTLMTTPLIRRMQRREQVFPLVTLVPLRKASRSPDERDIFMNVQIVMDEVGVAELRPFENQSAGNISTWPDVTGFARVHAGDAVNDRACVPYYDLQHWLV